MNNEQFLKNLDVPNGTIDVILDTDAYNELDDQFAVAYLIRSTEKLNVKALFAAPFSNPFYKNPKEGMERSHEEIHHLLDLLDEKKPVYKGSETYLPDEKTYVDSPAARYLVECAKEYSPEEPLYVVGIGAITNIASALLMAPEICENIVIVWLGGHARHYHDTNEYNMMQDVAAARVVMGSSAPFVQLPCLGVVNSFAVSRAELCTWMQGKNKICDYLANYTIETMDFYVKDTPWSRIIWDVTAVAWLLNDNQRFMKSRLVKTLMPEYDNTYAEKEEEKLMRYVYYIERDALMQDMFKKLTS